MEDYKCLAFYLYVPDALRAREQIARYFGRLHAELKDQFDDESQVFHMSTDRLNAYGGVIKAGSSI